MSLLNQALTSGTVSQRADNSDELVQPPRSKKPPWFPDAAKLSSGERASIQSFAAAFQKAASMDFYMTQYQGKAMESLTPLFKEMTEGIHRLQRQEAEEEAKAMEDKVTSAATDDKAEDMIDRNRHKESPDIAKRSYEHEPPGQLMRLGVVSTRDALQLAAAP